MVANAQKKWTVEEYLAFERSSEEKHEYIDGVVFPVGYPPKPTTQGVGRRHSLIITDVIRSLGNQLTNKVGEIYTNDMRIQVSADKFIVSDISIVSTEPQFANSEYDLLLNPTVIIEVLSPSTEHDDRGKKFSNYQTLLSLQEYILIAQDETRVEHYIRRTDNNWLVSFADTPETIVTLPSINCTLLLSDIYRKVTFETDDTTKDA